MAATPKKKPAKAKKVAPKKDQNEVETFFKAPKEKAKFRR